MKKQDRRYNYFVIGCNLSFEIAQIIWQISGSGTSWDLSRCHQRFRQLFLSKYPFVNQQETLESRSFLWKNITC